ncbi:MAG: lysylphosphatidylglycerol synthase transmembrane domain-containing protein [Cyanobacteria bacterium J06634_6]
MNKKLAFKFIRIAVTTALLVYVLHKADLLSPQGWKDLFATFSHANLWLILASILLGPVIDFISSVKWYALARACGMKVSVWRLYAYYMVGQFFNMILPSSIGGDFIRIHQLGKHTGRQADSAAVVFVERFSGLAMLVFLAAIAVIINLQMFNLPWLSAALLTGVLGVGMICWIIIDHRPYNFIHQRFGSTPSLVSSILTKIGKFRNAILIYKDKPDALWLAVFNSLLFYLLAIFNVWVSAIAFDSSIRFTSMLVAVPVIMFIMNLPFSIGGLGIMEFGYTYTLGLFGINPAVAISITILMRIKSLLAAGAGGLVYIFVEGMDSPKQLSKVADQIPK